MPVVLMKSIPKTVAASTTTTPSTLKAFPPQEILPYKRTLTKRRQRWPSAMAKIPYTCHVAHATKCNVEFVCRCFISNRMIPYIQRRKAMTLSSKQFAKIIVVEGYRSWIGEKHSLNIQSQKIQQYTQLIPKKKLFHHESKPETLGTN